MATLQTTSHHPPYDGVTHWNGKTPFTAGIIYHHSPTLVERKSPFVSPITPDGPTPPVHTHSNAATQGSHHLPETHHREHVAVPAGPLPVPYPHDVRHHIHEPHSQHHTYPAHGNGGFPDYPDYLDESDDSSLDCDSIRHFPNSHGDGSPSRYQHPRPAAHAEAPARPARLRASANGGPSLRAALKSKIRPGKARTDEFAPKPSLSAALKYSGRTAKAHGSALFTRKEVGIEHYAKGLYSKDARDKIRGSVGRIRDEHTADRKDGRGRFAGLKERIRTVNRA